MKKILLLFWLLLPASVQAQEVPESLAGIVLGSDISTVHQRCQMSTDLPLPDERHLNEIYLKPGFVPGVKSGTVAYATCAKKGAIVRIKLKFDNDSKDFFNKLLDRYKKQFGDPKEWRGDPFQMVVSWKWSFQSAEGRQINLELTHSEDEDYKTGNFVKMTQRSLWESEAACLRKSNMAPNVGDPAPTPEDQIDFTQLIPR